MKISFWVFQREASALKAASLSSHTWQRKLSLRTWQGKKYFSEPGRARNTFQECYAMGYYILAAPKLANQKYTPTSWHGSINLPSFYLSVPGFWKFLSSHFTNVSHCQDEEEGGYQVSHGSEWIHRLRSKHCPVTQCHTMITFVTFLAMAIAMALVLTHISGCSMWKVEEILIPSGSSPICV